jgi:hypothetical protein
MSKPKSTDITSAIAKLSALAGEDKDGNSRATARYQTQCASLAAALQLEQNEEASLARDELAVAQAKRKMRVAERFRSERIKAKVDERIAMAKELAARPASERALLERKPKPKADKGNGAGKAPVAQSDELTVQ